MLVWKRYGKPGSTIHAAHAFRDGVQLCNIKHGRLLRVAPERQYPEPHLVALSPHGQPFGHACARCLKLAGREGGS